MYCAYKQRGGRTRRTDRQTNVSTAEQLNVVEWLAVRTDSQADRQ